MICWISNRTTPLGNPEHSTALDHTFASAAPTVGPLIIVPGGHNCWVLEVYLLGI